MCVSTGERLFFCKHKGEKRGNGVITECPGCALNENDDASVIKKYLGARKMNNCYNETCKLLPK